METFYYSVFRLPVKTSPFLKLLLMVQDVYRCKVLFADVTMSLVAPDKFV